MPVYPRLPLLVLAGGHSRRMGRDKATLEWEGTPLLLRVLGRFSPLVVPIDRFELLDQRNHGAMHVDRRRRKRVRGLVQGR